MSDTKWGYHNRPAEIDYAHRAVRDSSRDESDHEAFYDKAPAQSYFGGCSNGGRQGVWKRCAIPRTSTASSVTRPLDLTSLNLNFACGRATGPDGRTSSLAELKPIESRLPGVRPLDGLTDGLIGDPRACRFDPSIWPVRREVRGCPSAQQVDALRALYQGPRLNGGQLAGLTGVRAVLGHMVRANV
jgi:feruloyl esterase